MSTARISTLNIGSIHAQLADWYGLPADHPYASVQEASIVQCYHLALPGRSVLVDAASLDLAPEHAHMLLPGPRPPALAEQLAALGTLPVTDVVITHAHFDHINGLTRRAKGGGFEPAFPGARHYLGAGDWDPANFDEFQNDSLAVLDKHGLLSLVHGPLDLGDGLEILPAPGESPGHQVLHHSGDGQETYVAGDLFHHRLEFEEPGRMVVWAERQAMQASQRMLAERAAASSTSRAARVYFTHLEGPYRVERDSEGRFHWRPA